MSLTIRAKLLLLFAALVALPLAAVGLVSYRNSLSSVQRVVEDRASRAAAAAAEELRVHLEPRLSEVGLLARNREVQGLYAAFDIGGLAGADLATPRLQAFLRQFMAGRRDAFAQLTYLDVEGAILLRYARAQGQATPGGGLDFQPYVTDRADPLMDGFAPSSVPASGQAMVSVYHPGYGPLLRLARRVTRFPDGAHVGFLLADLDVDAVLQGTIFARPPEEGEYVALVDHRQGRFLMHPEPSLSGSPLSRALPGLSLPAAGGAASVSGHVAAAAAGREWLIAYRDLEGTPASAAAFTIASRFTDPVRQAALGNLGITFGSLLLALVLLPFTVGRIARHIRQVTEGAEAIAGGDLDQRLEVVSRDETGVLAGAFNRMAESLKGTLNELRALTAELEDRVRRRTADLEEARRALEERNARLTIEAAVERVRAEALAMRSADDLPKVVAGVFRQLRALGVEIPSTSVFFANEETDEFIDYVALDSPAVLLARLGLSVERSASPPSRPLGIDPSKPFTFAQVATSVQDVQVDPETTVRVQRGRLGAAPSERVEEWRRQEVGSRLLTVPRDEQFLGFLADYCGVEPAALSDTELSAFFTGEWHITRIPSAYGAVSFRERELVPEHTAIARDFTQALELGYLRFLDFQRLERQNRELEVERALERLRTAVAGMERSEDLHGLVGVVHEALASLGVPCRTVGINVYDAETHLVHAHLKAEKLTSDTTLPSMQHWREHWECQATWHRLWTREDWARWRETVLRSGSLAADERRRLVEHESKHPFDDRWVVDAYFDHGSLAMNKPAPEPFADEHLRLLERFTEVFALGYRRHLDLAAAEERAREANLARARQRVRSEVAAMRSADDIERVVLLLRDELRDLGVPCDQVGINVVDEEAGTVRTTWNSVLDVEARRQVTRFGEYDSDRLVQHWREGTAWSRQRSEGGDDPDAPGWVVDVPFQFGTLAMNRGQTDPAAGEFSAAEIALLAGFAEAVSLGYTRFRDLRAIEERARRQAIEAAAERVRSAAMAMRSTGDLPKVAGVLQQRMLGLGVDAYMTVTYLDRDTGEAIGMHTAPNPRPFGLTWTSPEAVEIDDEVIVCHGQLGPDSNMLERVRALWKSGKPETGTFFVASRADVWDARYRRLGFDREAFLASDYLRDVEGEWLETLIPFSSGMVGFIHREADETHVALVQELTDALSLGFVRFLDFRRLEEQNTRLEQANQALAEANARVEAATRNKSEFLRRMSHDLRSPMNAIIGYSRLLLRKATDRLDEREQRNLRNIESSAGNLLTLINDILDLSRIEAGRVDLRLQPVDLRRLADECADSLASLVRPGVELRRELADVPAVQTDPDRLRQVLMNLLGNAVKFTQSGHITLSLAQRDAVVHIAVADTGIGIPPEELPHVFDEFRQVQRQGGEAVEGTGLGLSIAKKTVELLGGEISAESEVGRGTTFAVRLRDR